MCGVCEDFSCLLVGSIVQAGFSRSHVPARGRHFSLAKPCGMAAQKGTTMPSL
jgi:hypothetical protein